jgi:hypothetical protein
MTFAFILRKASFGGTFRANSKCFGVKLAHRGTAKDFLRRLGSLLLAL